MADYKDVVAKIKAAADKIQFEPGDDISKVIRFSMIDTGAGNDKSSFTTWFFGGGDIRHIAAYCHYVIWFTEHDESFSLDQLKEMLNDWIKQAGEFCGYCGFVEMWELVQDIMGCLDTVETKEALLEVANAMWLYASNMNSWIYQYIPWGVGYLFPIRDEKYFEEGLKYARMK